MLRVVLPYYNCVYSLDISPEEVLQHGRQFSAFLLKFFRTIQDYIIEKILFKVNLLKKNRPATAGLKKFLAASK